MLDPFRGELTARYVREDDLRWAARERLLRESRKSGEAQVPSRREARRFRLGFLPALSFRRSALKA